MIGNSLSTFISRGSRDVTLIILDPNASLKHFKLGMLTGYISELPEIIAQSEGFRTQDLIKEIDSSYQVIRKLHSGQGIEIPDKLNYTIKFVDIEDFFKKHGNNN